MRLSLLLTCLCDAFYGEVGIATVRVLERAGCEVVFDERQSCCGQPPFNAGDWESARRIARHARDVFAEAGLPIVAPSSSCAAMLREGYPMLFPGEPAPEVYELAEFLVHRLGVAEWPPNRELRPSKPSAVRKLAFHRACHGRALGLQGEAERLLASLPGVELVPIGQAEQCCGFGGAFSVDHPAVSAGIGLEKLHHFSETGAEEVVGGDMGCLMHLEALIRRHKIPLRTRHYAQLLDESG
jgi:L-lactate dehydrogenase complex protein LldE